MYLNICVCLCVCGSGLDDEAFHILERLSYLYLANNKVSHECFFSYLLLCVIKVRSECASVSLIISSTSYLSCHVCSVCTSNKTKMSKHVSFAMLIYQTILRLWILDVSFHFNFKCWQAKHEICCVFFLKKKCFVRRPKGFVMSAFVRCIPRFV